MSTGRGLQIASFGRRNSSRNQWSKRQWTTRLFIEKIIANLFSFSITDRILAILSQKSSRKISTRLQIIKYRERDENLHDLPNNDQHGNIQSNIEQYQNDRILRQRTK